jgi:hypothetical protein
VRRHFALPQHQDGSTSEFGAPSFFADAFTTTDSGELFAKS